jgi:hypothetical protein
MATPIILTSMGKEGQPEEQKKFSLNVLGTMLVG